MKPVLVKYERVFNLGNYESERLGVEITVEDGDDVESALTLARREVVEQFARNREADAEGRRRHDGDLPF